MDDRYNLNSAYRIGTIEQRGGGGGVKTEPKQKNKNIMYNIKSNEGSLDGLDGLRKRNRFLQKENNKLKAEIQELNKKLSN
tara:strand:+ start:674 stop:916 length:243 start_codon:yes stop_codon:yes gene_type:complete